MRVSHSVDPLRPEPVKKAQPGVLLALLWMGLLGLLGAVLGCGSVYLVTMGWFNGWRALPPAPVVVERLAGASVDSVDVAAADGQLYRYDLRAAGHWSPVSAAQTEQDDDCERFAQRAPALEGVRERRVACVNYAEAGVTTLYALKEDGRVYYWREESNAYTVLVLIVAAPLLGGLVGALIGLGVALAARKKG